MKNLDLDGSDIDELAKIFDLLHKFDTEDKDIKSEGSKKREDF